MFRNTFVRDFLTVLNSDGPRPLHLWELNIKYGSIKRAWDEELGSFTIEIRGSNISVCSINTTEDLGISLPYLIFGIRNLSNAYFTFKVTIRDERGMKRQIRFSNFESRQRRGTFQCSLPLCLGKSWDCVRMDLRSLTKQAFNATYVETSNIAIHANCRVRNVYFSKVLVPHEDLPVALSLEPRIRKKNFRRLAQAPRKSLLSAKSPPAPPATPVQSVELISNDGEEDKDLEEAWECASDDSESFIDEKFRFDLNLDEDHSK